MLSQKETVRVRFAPSPSGFLHIGGARVAIVNYLIARKYDGKFLIRIEDTDRERSTKAFQDSILESLKWLGFQPDEPIVIQSERMDRHLQVAYNLIKNGKAYYCNCSNEELDRQRKESSDKKVPFRYNGKCRDQNVSSENSVIRINMGQVIKTNDIAVDDLIKGKISVKTTELDDIVIVRSDGTPVYLLSVVVDDHDMEITHVIRGDDHFTNTFRQLLIYNACSWTLPQFAHLPLIHGEDGSKLSKRHGATGLNDFRDKGYLPNALVNYLTLLGWTNPKIKNNIISLEDSIKLFDLKKVIKSYSTFDYNILNRINNHYIKNTDNKTLIDLSKDMISSNLKREVTEDDINKLLLASDEVKTRSNTLVDFAEIITIYLKSDPVDFKDKDQIIQIRSIVEAINFDDSIDNINKTISELVLSMKLDRKSILNNLRYLLTGRDATPNLLNIMKIIGRDESLNRITSCL